VSYYEDGTRDFIFHFDDTAVDHFTVPTDLLPLAKTYFHVSAASLGNTKMRGHIMGLMRDTAVRDALAEAMDAAYCLMPSTSDLDFLFPDLTEDAAVDKMLAASAEVIVVKRGGEGATVLGGGERYDFAPHIVEEIDPTGAGDCFGGTFVALMAQGAPLKDAGEAANAAGAMAVTQYDMAMLRRLGFPHNRHDLGLRAAQVQRIAVTLDHITQMATRRQTKNAVLIFMMPPQMRCVQTCGVKGEDRDLLWVVALAQTVQRGQGRADKGPVGQALKMRLPIGEKPARRHDHIAARLPQSLFKRRNVDQFGPRCHDPRDLCPAHADDLRRSGIAVRTAHVPRHQPRKSHQGTCQE